MSKINSQQQAAVASLRAIQVEMGLKQVKDVIIAWLEQHVTQDGKESLLGSVYAAVESGKKHL